MKQVWFASLVLLFSTSLNAQFFDARNTAMGGVGVASSSYVNAAVFNPALLTRFDKSDDFGFTLPVFGVLISDEDELIDAIEEFQDTLDVVSAKLDAATATPADLADLANKLLRLDRKRATGNISAGFAVSLPSKELAVSVFAHTYLDAQTFLNIAAADLTTIATATSSTDIDNLASEGIIIGAAITDIGIALATEFDLEAATLSVGIVPKAQRIDTFNYSVNVNTYDEGDFDDDRYRDDETRFNVDVGAALSTAGFTVGLSAKNLLADKFDTEIVNGNQFTYHLDPTLIAGVAWTNETITVAVDVDVLEIERFKRDDDVQLLRAGVEVNVFGQVQLRGGFRTDLADTLQDIISAGIGVSPFELFRLEIAAMLGENDTYGGVIQLSFTF